jgi:hypothetical protein
MPDPLNSGNQGSGMRPTPAVLRRADISLQITEPTGEQPNKYPQLQVEADPVHRGLPCHSHRGLGGPPSCGPKAPPPHPPQQAPPDHNKFDQIFGGSSGEGDNDKGWDSKWGFCMPTAVPHVPPTTHATRPAPPQPIPCTSVQTRAALEKEPWGVLPAMAAHPGLDVATLLSTLLAAQSEVQLAQMNANHANLIAFQMATAQALTAKSGDKDSKLSPAK